MNRCAPAAAVLSGKTGGRLSRARICHWTVHQSITGTHTETDNHLHSHLTVTLCTKCIWSFTCSDCRITICFYLHLSLRLCFFSYVAFLLPGMTFHICNLRRPISKFYPHNLSSPLCTAISRNTWTFCLYSRLGCSGPRRNLLYHITAEDATSVGVRQSSAVSLGASTLRNGAADFWKYPLKSSRSSLRAKLGCTHPFDIVPPQIAYVWCQSKLL